MATRLSLFDHPFFLGFDHIERELDRVKKTSDGYPPYNVEQTGDNTLRISLAVAGFTMDDLDVEIEHNQLVIRGKQTDDEDRIFLHRGIAARQFQKTFVLADGIEVADAHLDNGLLHIDMERIIPESSARKIEIKSKNAPAQRQLTGKTVDAIDIEDGDDDTPSSGKAGKSTKNRS